MTRNSIPPASSLRMAFEQDKGAAIKRRLSVERLADLHAVTPALLYKWLEEGGMPAKHLAGWFHHTGGVSVIRYLAVQAGGLFIPLPTGNLKGATDVQALQQVLHDAVGCVLTYMQGHADKDTTIAGLTAGLEALAFERAQVERSDQPELDFAQ